MSLVLGKIYGIRFQVSELEIWIFKRLWRRLLAWLEILKINCLSCLSNELSLLTPRVRLRRQSRVRGVTFGGIRVGLVGSRANLACVKV